MNPRFESRRVGYSQVGYSWVLRMACWVALVGSVLVAAPIAVVFGQAAALWALGGVAAVVLTYSWLGVEAVHAWRGPRVVGEGVDSVALASR